MRRALPLLLALAIAGCGGSTGTLGPPRSFVDGLPAPLAHSETTPLHDQGFVTAVPAGWHARLAKGDGSRSHFLNSGVGEANDFGLAGEGQVGLTIARQRTQDPSAAAALERIVGTPPNAVGVHRIQPTASARLAGAEAATTQYTYSDSGVTYVQSNLVAVAGSETIFIEVDAPPAQAAEGARAFATVIQNWRWTTSGGHGVNS
jgi:hypothetical protein